jgi:hypothetical protein
MSIYPNYLETADITADERALVIERYRTDDRDIVRFFQPLAPEFLPDALERTLRVGALCLEKAQQSVDVDFVNRRIEAMLGDVEAYFQSVPLQIEAMLDADDSGALRPLKRTLGEVESNVEESLEKVREHVASLIDPENPSAGLGAVLAKVQGLLDPVRTDSVPYQLRASIERVAAEEGPLAKAVGAKVEEVVSQAVKPLRDRLAEMEKSLLADRAVEEIIQGSTLKGRTFEEELLDRVKAFADQVGGEAYRGDDKSPGDVLLIFGADSHVGFPARIVFEAKTETRSKGRRAVVDGISRAMQAREADLGVYVSRTAEGLGREIGVFADGACEEGRYVACTLEFVPVALRLLLCLKRLENQARGAERFDADEVLAQVASIRSGLKRVAAIRANLTKLLSAAGAVREQVTELEREIGHSADAIAGCLRAAGVNESDSDLAGEGR